MTDPSWMAEAACRDAPTEWFFFDGDRRGRGPGADPVYARALALCTVCPVWRRCRDVGMGEAHGMFGGLTPAQRDQVRRRRRRQCGRCPALLPAGSRPNRLFCDRCRADIDRLRWVSRS